jgi:Zn-dependent M28 family amino/carboxypeptidase
VHFIDQPRPGRNVVAILPGSDPRLSGEYVAIGAHNDHLPMAEVAVDHDSLKVFNLIARPQGADGDQTKTPSPEQWKRINAMIDSLHKRHGGARRDSIYNGADDDGSGTVSVLEIAEAFARGIVKPRRSILFIWHAGEEKGLWGSEYFTDHPTVPRDSIVAELNMDMVGRGQPADVTGTAKDGAPIHGAANYLQLIGSHRLSTELGDLVEQVNTDNKLGFTFDYALDADGHPENIYCRSDHAEYARYGIPIVFFTTGGHADYHQVTDEPQYIQYGHMAKVDELVFDLALRVAGLDHRVRVDKPKPADPHGVCQQ